MSNDEIRMLKCLLHSDFEFRTSFIIWLSTFVIRTLPLRLRVRNLRGLIDNLRPPKTEPLIQSACPAILGRHFEKHAADTRGLEPRQRMPQENRTQAQAPMLGRDAHVLNRAYIVFCYALDRA